MYDYETYEEFWNNPISDYHRLLEPFLLEIFQELTNSSIIEIGFGSAHLPHLLTSVGFAGNYLGVDVNESAVDFATNRFPDEYFQFKIAGNADQIAKSSCDVLIFCLSACEMSNEILLDYLASIKSKKLIIINPSTITNYFESKIVKLPKNKITSRIGFKPEWTIIGKIPEVGAQKRNYFINKSVHASMYYRSTGDLLNICTQAGYTFEFYQDLGYKENTIKTAPVSKFEVLSFEKK
jgi:hypothetical protein